MAKGPRAAFTDLRRNATNAVLVASIWIPASRSRSSRVAPAVCQSSSCRTDVCRRAGSVMTMTALTPRSVARSNGASPAPPSDRQHTVSSTPSSQGVIRFLIRSSVTACGGVHTSPQNKCQSRKASARFKHVPGLLDEHKEPLPGLLGLQMKTAQYGPMLGVIRRDWGKEEFVIVVTFGFWQWGGNAGGLRRLFAILFHGHYCVPDGLP